MSIYPKSYTIKECEGFVRGVGKSHFRGLHEPVFDALEAFILANKSDAATDVDELLSLSVRRGAGRIIAARNYVGVIALNDGTTIEILPKISGYVGEDQTRRSFLEMLRTLKDTSFKTFSMTHLKADRLNLFEIFIKMFIDEVSVITAQGLKAAYKTLESNELFCKGKLLTSQQIKYNLFRKDRFFVNMDDFSMNRPENRLLRSTLVFLLRRTNDARNRRDAIRLLAYFDGVADSIDCKRDFATCNIGPGMTHYRKALAWCRVFLLGNSFTAFAGSEVAFALLFPMEKIFESFVAEKIRKHAGYSYSVRVQHRQYSLFDIPRQTFNLRPDIVLHGDGKTIVLDSKWKMLSNTSANNFGIMQSDMYQAYAYGKKYNANKVVLLFPSTNPIKEMPPRYVSSDGVVVEIAFIDLLNADKSMAELLHHITENTVSPSPLEANR